jgi:Xaa-Pro aminopeptidase
MGDYGANSWYFCGMSVLTREKLAQAAEIVAASGLDAWITFVRETAEGGDPVLPFLIEGGLTWQSALIVTRDGRKIAVVGNYDADPLKASGDWDEVVPYVQSIREPLLDVLTRCCGELDSGRVAAALVDPTVEAGIAGSTGPDVHARLGVNYSLDNVKADGLGHGMYLLLESYLKGTRFENCLESASDVVSTLRGRKTAYEIACIRAAVAETDAIFSMVDREVRTGMSEREVYDRIQSEMDARGLGYAWDRAGDPIVNSGPNSMVGHGIPSSEIRIEPGHIFHIDLGVIRDGYSSDIQCCWYVPHPGETSPPEDVLKATTAVVGAITAGSEVLRPGVEGWEVDAAARSYLVSQGYPEYLHAFGHQVGRMAHDGGAVLGPKWERYGKTPTTPICEDEVYTLELGVDVEGRGYLGIEEMVRVTADGVEWLTDRQLDMPLLPGQSAV